MSVIAQPSCMFIYKCRDVHINYTVMCPLLRRLCCRPISIADQIRCEVTDQQRQQPSYLAAQHNYQHVEISAWLYQDGPYLPRAPMCDISSSDAALSKKLLVVENIQMERSMTKPPDD